MIEHWTDRLSEYLDGELSPADRAAVEAHLERCEECGDALEDLRLVVAKAAGLTAREPSRDLWSDVRARIEAEADPDILTLSPGQPSRRRRFSFSVPQLAAAAVALMLVSGGSVWIGYRTASEPDPTPIVAGDAGVAGGAPVRSVSDVLSSGGEPSIEELQRLLDANRDRLDPVTVAVLESNLRIIDAAIVEARAALARDPNNVYIRQHLDQTIEKKAQVLRRVAALGRAEI